jgi:hypothetical protein
MARAPGINSECAGQGEGRCDSLSKWGDLDGEKEGSAVAFFNGGDARVNSGGLRQVLQMEEVGDEGSWTKSKGFAWGRCSPRSGDGGGKSTDSGDVGMCR